MKPSRIAILAISGVLPLLAAESGSAAAKTFDWTLTGPSSALGGVPLPGSGTLTATPTGGGAWDVQSISGEVGGMTIKGVTTFFLSDNVIYPAGLTQISTGGIAFETDAGTKIDIFSFFGQGTSPSGNAYGEYTTSGFGVGTFAMTEAVPEPATWAMMAIGFVSVAFLGYRRARPSFTL
jgi:hypothetical protein